MHQGDGTVGGQQPGVLMLERSDQRVERPGIERFTKLIARRGPRRRVGPSLRHDVPGRQPRQGYRLPGQCAMRAIISRALVEQPGHR